MKTYLTLLLVSMTLVLTCCRKREINKSWQPKIVMLGDSETRRINHYWGPDTNWNTLMDYDSIFNYGYDAYNSGDILSGPVYDAMNANPDVIFLMIGINDAHQSIPLSTTLSNIRILIDTIRGRNIDLVIQSVFPTTNYYDTLYGGFPTNGILATRAKIMSDSIRNICLQKDVPWLDIRQGLVIDTWYRNQILYLRNDKSIDGIHLNYAGYQVWADHLQDYITNNY